MPKVKINGEEIEVATGMTVLQACEQAGLEIPRFCYHDKLSIAGNCRMCLVEVKPGPPKPQASCALPIAENMEIFTNTHMVQKARHGVMEFLLMNHPLDCPICDQGGECDLQDQAMGYGRADSRYDEDKRAVNDKEMGPLINTVMTRCIHCTRCVRFSTEIAGVDTMGLLNRGEHAEISTLERAIASELSGNLIDLCPVGALTSKPYQFNARPWELNKTESIDVLDAMGANIRIDARGNQVLRVLPRINEAINEEWISDKTRFAVDGLKYQRLDACFGKNANGFEKLEYHNAIDGLATRLGQAKPDEIAIITGNQTDCETLFALKHLAGLLQTTRLECRLDGEQISGESYNHLLNGTLEGVENADFILLVGANPRKTAPVFNARIRKAYLTGKTKIYYIGADKPDLTYQYTHLGSDLAVLAEILDGKYIDGAQRPTIITDYVASAQENWDNILQTILAIGEKFGNGQHVHNYLHHAIGRVAGVLLGFTSDGGMQKIISDCQSGAIKYVILAGADEGLPSKGFGKAEVIYMGHHGDNGVKLANLIFPTPAYTEKSATYINTEGRVQRTSRAVFAPGVAKHECDIISDLCAKLNLASPREFLEWQYAMIQFDHALAGIGQIIPNDKPKKMGKPKKLSGIIGGNTSNFYLTCAISRASPTMAKCAQQFAGQMGGNHA